MVKYCVVKDTVIDIAQSEDVDKLIENALSTRLDGRSLTEDDFEILTEEEYQARVDAEPKPPEPPTEQERLQALEDAMLYLTLGGI